LDPCSVADTQNRLASDDANFEAQAGQFCYEAVGSKDHDPGITQFYDQNPSFTCGVVSEPDPTRGATDDPDTDLGNFFERPIEIATLQWGTTLAPSGLLKPWTLWMRNKRVANRLSNFRNFRASLHVKFLINGNQFYWGRMLMSYKPNYEGSFVGTDSSWLSVTPASQRPHVWIDPSTSQGGEMILPFFYPQDCFQLTGGTNPDELGELWYHTLVPLEHTQSLSDPVTITIMAWATDVQLTSPTQANVTALVPQAGDEYGKNIISKPANLVAAIAKKLEKAPVIGPYAMATSMAAGTVGNIASMFGYSRPRNIEPAKRVEIQQTGDLANTDAPDASMTLAFTSKHEVTIDPRTTGLGSQDEMDFSYLASKDSLFEQVAWNISDPRHQPLISIGVTPMMYNVGNYVIAPAPNSGYAFTTTAFVAQPFLYWRGSMTYRFQVVGSGYHKGRLLAVWDPVGSNAVPELNTVYSKIIDVAEERDFSITVGWGSSHPALEVAAPVTLGYLSGPKAVRSLYTPVALRENGVLTLYVLNPLVSSGGNTSPVQLLCHCYSDDLQVYAPTSDNIHDTSYHPQSGMLEAQSGEIHHGDDNTPQVENAAEDDADLGTVGGEMTNLSILGVLAGEQVTSFRVLLKRYCMSRLLPFNLSVPSLNVFLAIWSANGYFPVPGEAQPVGFYEGPMTIQAYLSRAFAGWRGSTRFKLLPLSIANGESSQTLVVNRGNAQWADVSPGFVVNDKVSMRALYDLEESWSGCAVSNIASGNVVHIELPWYSRDRFAYTHAPFTSSRALGYEAHLFQLNPFGAAANITGNYAEYLSVGEDYNVFFFMGVPPLWQKNLPP
jgi:hypothetical protein